jgi:hypothetical protein
MDNERGRLTVVCDGDNREMTALLLEEWDER